MTVRSDWGPEFWQKYYVSPETRVATGDELYEEGYWLMYTVLLRLQVPLDSILDIGSGTGDFSDGMAAWEAGLVKRIEPYGPDPNAIRASAGTYQFKGHDMLVCRDVLQYFTGYECASILNKMDHSGAKVLYIRFPKKEDVNLSKKCDTECVLHSGRELRRQLTNYTNRGMGIWTRSDVPVFLLAGE
jgi:hypothetical protein